MRHALYLLPALLLSGCTDGTNVVSTTATTATTTPVTAWPEGDGIITTTYSVPGMVCDHCASTLNKGIPQTPGVLAAAVDLPTKTVKVAYKPAEVTPEKLVAAVDALGFEAKPTDGSDVPATGRPSLTEVEAAEPPAGDLPTPEAVVPAAPAAPAAEK